MKKKIGIMLAALLTVLSCAFPAAAWAEVDFIVDYNYETPIQPIPKAYTLTKTIAYLGSEYGTLSAPQDLFVSDQDILYVADTGNDRILRFNAAGEVDMAVEGAADDRLRGPQSVYADNYGAMYVADTGNNRIIKYSRSGKTVETFGTPKSDVLSADFVMSPRRVAVSSTGYLYVIRNQSIMQMDAYNNFRGYISAGDVGFDLWYQIRKWFSTEKQQHSMQKREPASCLSFDVAADGTLYVTTADAAGQLKKISSVSKNIYPKKDGFGYTVTVDGTAHTPYFTDLSVASDGLIFLLESWGGEIHVYDDGGNNLAVFGGIGESADDFTDPIAVDTDSRGNVYVLDAAANCIKVFAPTRFMELVTDAVTLYSNGDYVGAVDYWKQVTEIDSNYALANKGFAKAYYKQGQYKLSMEHYEMCNDKAGYSAAFSKYRLEVLRQHFGWVVSAAVVLVVLVIVLIRLFLKRVGRVIRRYYSKI